MSFSGNRLALAAAIIGTGGNHAAGATFAEDLQFLRQHAAVVLLSTPDGQAQLVLVPDYQGRVMTSSARGAAGISHGWLNRPVIARGPKTNEGNPYGGEDRFWLAPMGGQFSLFYPPGRPFNDDHWRVPAGLNLGAAEVVRQGTDFAELRFTIEIENYQRTRFTVDVNRRISLLGRASIAQLLGFKLDAAGHAVGFETINTAINRGEPWKSETGLLSVWILGMFPGHEATTIMAPCATTKTRRTSTATWPRWGPTASRSRTVWSTSGATRATAASSASCPAAPVSGSAPTIRSVAFSRS